MYKKAALIFGFILGALLLGGCAHYRPGTGNKPLYHTIAFAPVKNNSFAPQIDTLMTDALVRSFARGGGMAVESQGHAEATLKVTLNEFHKMIGATSSSDTGRARSLVMVLKATATLTDAQGQAIYVEDFEAHQETYADSGMALAENEAMPQLAEALAEKIYRSVVSVW